MSCLVNRGRRERETGSTPGGRVLDCAEERMVIPSVRRTAKIFIVQLPIAGRFGAKKNSPSRLRYGLFLKSGRKDSISDPWSANRLLQLLNICETVDFLDALY